MCVQPLIDTIESTRSILERTWIYRGEVLRQTARWIAPELIDRQGSRARQVPEFAI